MSYNGNGLKLTGNDGVMKEAAFGLALPGDGATALPVGVYFVTAVAAVSTFPAPADGGDEIEPGYFIEVVGTASITPAIGDDVVTMVLTDKCDVSSWAMDFTKSEIDVTTSCDVVKVYRAGRADMTGTIEGINTVGITDDPEGSLREFITIVRQDGDVSYDVFSQEGTILLGFFYTNITTQADQMKIIAPFQLQGMTQGAAIDTAQAFSSGFRFANLKEPVSDIDVKIAFYRLGDGT